MNDHFFLIFLAISNVIAYIGSHRPGLFSHCARSLHLCNIPLIFTITWLSHTTLCGSMTICSLRGCLVVVMWVPYTDDLLRINDKQVFIVLEVSSIYCSWSLNYWPVCIGIPVYFNNKYIHRVDTLAGHKCKQKCFPVATCSSYQHNNIRSCTGNTSNGDQTYISFL